MRVQGDQSAGALRQGSEAGLQAGIPETPLAEVALRTMEPNRACKSAGLWRLAALETLGRVSILAQVIDGRVSGQR